MSKTKVSLLALAWAVTGGLLLTSCDVPPPTALEGLQPLFDQQPDCVSVNGSPDADVYNPCIQDGILVVGHRHRSDPLIPGGEACTFIPGGCFPGDGTGTTPPVFGPTPYYGYGGPYLPKGTFPGGVWMQGTVRALTSTERGAVQMAIREITNHDADDVCQPIINALISKLGQTGGFIAAENHYSVTGEFRDQEVGGGSIYINIYHANGYNWLADGSVDETELRRTVTEEGIHLYFDSDVGHESDDSQEKKDAMQDARYACGYYN